MSTGSVLAWQAVITLALLGLWEYAGTTSLGAWVSRPSLIAGQLLGWMGGALYRHLFITLAEMGIGLAVGGSLGVLAGLVIGHSPLASSILRPIVVALYSVPMVALSPLFIIFFGLYMLPKIILVTKVVFFLMFFSVFSGVTQVDRDIINSLRLMGASRTEEFRKVILPGCMVWIIGGLKISLPYALVAAVTGEMLAATAGIGYLINDASVALNMTGLYAALLVLMVLGLLIGEVAVQLERRMLRWRNASE